MWPCCWFYCSEARFRSLPIFTALITLDVVRTITLFLRWHNAQSTYFYMFWSLAVVDVGLQFGIVYELSSKVFRPLGQWAPDIRKKSVIWIVASIVFTSLLTLIPRPSSHFWMQELILKGSFFSAALMSELFVGMISISAVAGLGWSNHVAKVAKGFTVYSIATLVLETANTCLGLGGNGHIYDDLSRIRIAIYSAALDTGSSRYGAMHLRPERSRIMFGTRLRRSNRW
jgi:hypothetical protein